MAQKEELSTAADARPTPQSPDNSRSCYRANGQTHLLHRQLNHLDLIIQISSKLIPMKLALSNRLCL